MYSTLAELKAKILIAKNHFIEAAAQWLKEEKELSQEDKEQWLASLGARDRDTMANLIANASLLRIRSSVETVSESPHQQVYKTEYCPSGDESTPLLNELAILTTLMDHLHQLEGHLKPFSLDFKKLNFSQAKIKGIALCWPHVEVEQNTVDDYSKQLADAQQRLQRAKEDVGTQLDYLGSKIDVHIIEFAYITRGCADLLSSAYALRPDTRSLAFLRRNYTPWQELLRQLAVDLFADVTTVDNKESRGIAITEMVHFYQEQQDLSELREQYQEKCAEIEGEWQQMQDRIALMAQSLNPQANVTKAKTIVIGGSNFFLHTKYSVSTRAGSVTDGEDITVYKEIQL